MAAQKVYHLKPSYFFGLATEVKGNVHLIDDNTILYTIGRVFLFHNIHTEAQHYMKIPESSKILTRIAISPNRKLIAVVEKGTKPTISVFNLETRHRVILLGNPLNDDVFEFVSFTCDNEHVVAITGSPEWTMIYYRIDGRVESYDNAVGDVIVPASVNGFACNPSDPTILCIVGPGLFRFISWTDNQWVQYGFNAADKLDITSVCWITDEIVIAGTKCGRLLAVEYGDVRGVYRANLVTEIKLVKGENRVDMMDTKSVAKGYKFGIYAVSALTSFSQGFAYSFTPSMIVVFERVDFYTWIKRTVLFTIEAHRSVPFMKQEDIVGWISIAPSGQKLVCSTRRKEIYFCDIHTGSPLPKPATKLCHRVFSGFHIGRVACIAACRSVVTPWKKEVLSSMW